MRGGKNRKKSVAVVVAEQDERLREHELLPGLASHGFDAVGVGTAAALYRALVGDRYELVVVGAELPDEDGLAVARHLRRHSALGIAMLMERTFARDHAEVFHAGVDLCFIKPVETAVLAASLRSLAMQAGGAPARVRRDTSWSLKADGWQLNPPGRNALALSAPERVILRRLFASSQAPVPRAALIDDLMSSLDDFDPSSFERVMHRLRRRVLQRTGVPLPLATIRGAGYMLVLDSAT